MENLKPMADDPIGRLTWKICSSCKQQCEVSLFHRNAKSPDLLDNRCAPCKADQKRLALYDLTATEYKRMLFMQNSECAVCRRGLPELDQGLVVDHDHDTGAVRGLICQDCNRALGFVRDDVYVLKRAIEYLEVQE